VRVGHRQALNTQTPASLMLGFFISAAKKAVG
jgi:hypothetical protein